MDFPQYRKLSNDRSFYRIISKDYFDELQLMGERCFIHSIKAVQYPEKLRIMEMLDCFEGFVMSSQKEWEEIEKRLN